MPTDRKKQLVSVLRDTLARIDSLTDRLEMTLDCHREWLSDARIKELESKIATQRISNQKKREVLDKYTSQS
jgi:hypothetical protein